jgi:hypothetical protein
MNFLKVEPTNYGGWGIYLTSGCDEYTGCRLNVRAPGKWITLRLPEIIRPVRRWVDLSGQDWATPCPDGRKGYTEVLAREYSISYGENYLHIRYGQQTNCSTDTKSWCTELPWLARRFVRHSLFDLSGNKLCDLPQEGEWRERHKIEDEAKAAQPKAYFLFRDYDGEEIRARCRVEEREWKRGTGWFKWLSWFYAPTVHRSLDLWFSSEVGSRKGSWKGGTLGHAAEMQPGDSAESAFRRYCEKQKLALIGESHEWEQAA